MPLTCDSSCMTFKIRQVDGGRGQNRGHVLGTGWLWNKKENPGVIRERGDVPCLDLGGGFVVRKHGIYT